MFTTDSMCEETGGCNNSGCQCTVETQLEHAAASMNNGEYRVAEQHLLRVIQADPFHARAHGRLGGLYWRTQRTEDALNSLTRALELDPEDREIVLNCAEVMRSYGRVEDVQLVLSTYLGKNPDDGEVQQMLMKMTESLDGDKPMDIAEFFNEQGEVQFGNSRMDHARACFEMALEKNPHHAIALSNLGIVLWREGNAEASLGLLYKALELNPEDPDILFNCHEVLKAVGDRQSAAMLLQMYLRKGFGGQREWDAYEQLLLQSGADSWNSLGLSDDVASIYTEMGKSLHAAGDVVGAAQSFERAFVITPQNPEVYLELAQVLLETDRAEAALDVIGEGLIHDPSHEGLVLMMSRLLVEQDRKSDAKAALERALEVKDNASVQAAWNELTVAQAV